MHLVPRNILNPDAFVQMEEDQSHHEAFGSDFDTSLWGVSIEDRERTLAEEEDRARSVADDKKRKSLTITVIKSHLDHLQGSRLPIHRF
jgi:hypothetical protein